MKAALPVLLFLIQFASHLAVAATPPFALSITNTAPNLLEISLPTEPGFQYQIEGINLIPAATGWKVARSNIVGDGTIVRFQEQVSVGTQRFFRAMRTPISSGISANAVAPVAGMVYPANTIIGAGLLGLQFTIPNQWKAAVRQGTSQLLLGSDTEPGLIVAFISLAGDARYAATQLGQSFTTGNSGGFKLVQPPVINGNLLSIEWQGYGDQVPSLLQVRAIAHPSGGVVAFAGFFWEANRAVMERVLGALTASTVTTPRDTRSDLVTLIAGKAFSWARSTSAGNGGDYGSMSRWSQNNAFFCPGTYEITTYSESSYSGNLSGGSVYSGGSSSRSTEAGDWTIVNTPSGPAMIMISSSGFQASLLTLSGNSVVFGNQQFDYAGPNRCN